MPVKDLGGTFINLSSDPKSPHDSDFLLHNFYTDVALSSQGAAVSGHLFSSLNHDILIANSRVTTDSHNLPSHLVKLEFTMFCTARNAH